MWTQYNAVDLLFLATNPQEINKMWNFNPQFYSNRLISRMDWDRIEKEKSENAEWERKET